MDPKIYGYARVSTVGQAKDGNSLEAQKSALKAAGATDIYIDTFTGTKMERPEFDRLNMLLQDGDTLIVTKLDRFARTVGQASELITNLIDRGITVNVLNLGILDNGSISVLLRHAMDLLKNHSYTQVASMTGISKSTLIREKKQHQEG